MLIWCGSLIKKNISVPLSSMPVEIAENSDLRKTKWLSSIQIHKSALVNYNRVNRKKSNTIGKIFKQFLWWVKMCVLLLCIGKYLC